MEKPLALVIEDDPDASFIFSQALKANGFEPKAIGLGDTASRYLKELSPELIMLDMHLPNIPGTELIKEIRSYDNTKNALIIVASADPRMAESVEHLADLVLIKPITFSQVRDLIGRIVNSKKQ